MTLESAVSLPEAVEKLRTFQPDVLAVSYSMSFQHQDGQELLRLAQASCPHLLPRLWSG
jgi:hypothetical protein